MANVLPRPALPFGTAGTPTDGESAEAIDIAVSAADTEVLRTRDVATLSAVERADVRKMISMLAVGTAPRASRRRIHAVRGDIDPGRTVRAMLRRGGEPTRLVRRRRRTVPRRLVLLVDVSGSMSPYATRCCAWGSRPSTGRRTGPRYSRSAPGSPVSLALYGIANPDAALRAAGAAIPDWHGGTRLAESLKAFLDRWGQRGVARGAVVVLCSDGWERGDAGPLAEQVARLSRLAYRLVWVNPHRGKPGFEPLAAGMNACLPHLDAFVSGHSLGALEELVEVIAHA